VPSLIHEVSVLRFADLGTDDDWNVPEQSWATVATDVPALVQHRRGREVPAPNRAGPAIATAVIFTGPDADITEKDAIAWNGEEWSVLQVRNAGGVGHHLEIDAERIRL
jgi:hypothetical protein